MVQRRIGKFSLCLESDIHVPLEMSQYKDYSIGPSLVGTGQRLRQANHNDGTFAVVTVASGLCPYM